MIISFSLLNSVITTVLLKEFFFFFFFLLLNSVFTVLLRQVGAVAFFFFYKHQSKHGELVFGYLADLGYIPYKGIYWKSDGKPLWNYTKILQNQLRYYLQNFLLNMPYNHLYCNISTYGSVGLCLVRTVIDTMFIRI